MQIVLKQPGQPVADIAVSGAVLTVAGIAIDCAARQTDAPQTIEVRLHNGQAHEGGNGAYLAQIDIPPRDYTETPAETEGQPPTRTPVELDPNRVVATLWPTNQ
ncbi:MAG: hypothetical protein LBL69_06425 [Zoogloeaceae bacterium]|jgi:hypothetical protein|nr:hypothetical protein [Zoogloeaceae bacterium]